MKREDNELMREKILDAVIVCKIEAAGADVSLSHIASRAGISERTLNRYFPDKEILLYEASIKYLRRAYDSLSVVYNAYDKSGMTGLKKLILLLSLQIEHNRQDMSNAKTFVRAYTTALRTAVYRDLPATGYDASLRTVVFDCIAEGTRDGSMRSNITAQDAYYLISSNYMGLVQRLIYFYSVDCPREEHKKQLLLVFDMYIHMLEEYLSANGRSN